VAVGSPGTEVVPGFPSGSVVVVVVDCPTVVVVVGAAVVVVVGAAVVVVVGAGVEVTQSTFALSVLVGSFVIVIC
jgi:hypothetical protein